MDRRNLYKFVLKTYRFGDVRYPILYVRAMNIEDARQFVYDDLKYHNDEDAKIESEEWIDMCEDGIIAEANMHK